MDLVWPFWFVAVLDAIPATAGVVGVRTGPKIQVGVSDTPKTSKGNIAPTSH